jgi:Glycosyltransferase involved in LPS biosynthesis
MTFFDAFDSIRILNLPHRADRRREMMEELTKLGLAEDPRVSFFEASVGSDAGPFLTRNVHGCFLSHLALLETAAKAGERVLVLEDDCDFNSAARDYELPADWDIFYGGYEADDPSDLENSNIIGAHCMGYTPQAARRLAAYLRTLLEDPTFPADGKAAREPDFDPAIRPPFDGAIVWFRRANRDLKTSFAQIAVQRSSRSDITASALDRSFPGLASIARKAKNAAKRLLVHS